MAVAASAALTPLYRQLGHRVLTEVLQGKRAEYGAQIVAAVGQLEVRHGRGFGEKNLRRMVQFAEVFDNAEIVAALLRQLGWAGLLHRDVPHRRLEYPGDDWNTDERS